MPSTALQVVLQLLLATLIIFGTLTFLSSDATAKRARPVKLTGTTPLEAQFFNDLRDKDMKRWTLSDAFFIASGIRDEANLNRARAWMDQLVNEARGELAGLKKTEERADKLLHWIHHRALSTYRAESTDALELIRNGKYNCLSSCLLYGMIGERLGLHIRGIAVEHHAFCRVYDQPLPKRITSMKSRSGGWDVETTTEHGFNPGRQVQMERMVISVPRHQYRNRREISLVEMIGLIYTNHIGLTRSYPSTSDRLLAYQKAALFFPRDPIIQHNVIAAHTQLINELVQQRKWASAAGYAQQLEEVDSSDQYSTSTWLMLIDRHLENIASQGIKEILSQLDEYQQRAKKPPKSVWLYWRARMLGQAAGHELLRGREAEGLTRLKQVLSYLKQAEQQRPRLERSRREKLETLRHNSLVPLKNVIITLMNSGKHAQASSLLNATLRIFPRDGDLKTLQQSLARISK